MKLRSVVAILLLAAGCGDEKQSKSGGRVSVVSRGDRIDEAAVVEKGKVTVLLYFADW